MKYLLLYLLSMFPCPDRTPDHYTHWLHQLEPLSVDLCPDFRIDQDDLSLFALGWTDYRCLQDFNHDLTVDYRDFAILARNWNYADPNQIGSNDPNTR